MLQAILYIIPIFIVYRFIRSSWISNETLKTRYRIARLKDELNWLAISGVIDRKNKECAHLYASIDKVLTALPRFSFWVMLYLLIKQKQKVNTNEIKKVLNEVEKNEPLKEIYDRFYKLLITYIARKNVITVILTIPFWKRILDARLSQNTEKAKSSNASECTDDKEYSSCAFYFHITSTRSLLLG